jgi:hypothetical protein
MKPQQPFSPSSNLVEKACMTEKEILLKLEELSTKKISTKVNETYNPSCA